MGFLELLLLAVGVSMDAFAVSVCKGLSMGRAGLKESAICGGWFGGFQALMPLIGFFLGTLFADAIVAIDHWVAFGLLAVGISLAMAGNVNIWVAIVLIGLTTFTLSGIGVKVGNVFGSRFEKKAQIAGGCILILLGTKILLEHLGILG